jgi:hypothetical protein
MARATPKPLTRRQTLSQPDSHTEHNSIDKEQSALDLSDSQQESRKKRKTSAKSTSDSNSLLGGNRRGAELFTDLDCFTLNGNPRAENDPKHAEYVAQLHRGCAIDPAELLSRYKLLSTTDMVDDVTWRFATVIVPNNRERIDIIARTIVDFAKHTGQPVVRWQCNIKCWTGAPMDDDLRKQAMEDPCFWQYFATWADGICNDNLSVNINLTNGAPIRLYSLTFATKQQRLDYEDMRDRAQPGDIITLQAPPLSVNVIPWPDSTTEEHKKYDAYSIERALPTRQPVIPISAQSHSKTPSPVAVYDGEGWFTTKAIVVPEIPFDLAYAMTSFKAQGRTLPRVILSLAHRFGSYNNFSFHEILVAISRVKMGDDIRIIPPHNKQTKSFDYLSKLRPNPEIMQLLKGLQTLRWNPEMAWSERQLHPK